MTSRMTWLVSSQSFLFAAFFLGVERLRDGVQAMDVLIFGIPVAGLSIALITYIYVSAAHTLLIDLRAERRSIQQRYPLQLLDKIDQSAAGLFRRQAVQHASVGLIALFTAFWLIAASLLISDMFFSTVWFQPGNSAATAPSTPATVLGPPTLGNQAGTP